MPALLDRGATVNRLRIRCRLDPLAARLRASRLLDDCALQPATLPPSAILCIRRLTDPRPGLIALDGVQRPSAMWTEAVSSAVADLARRASRPGLGDVTAGADAVLFADRAEMLACLAADWCAGRLGALWWWRALLHDIGDMRGVVEAWLKTPAYIAASFDELARRGGAVAFVERLSRADARALLTEVVVQHDLKWLSPVLRILDRPEGERAGLTSGGSAPADRPRADGGAPALDMVPRAPWTRWVHECRAELRVDQQCLLAVALMTRRAPASVRTVRFAAEFQRWLDLVHQTESTSDVASDPPPMACRGDQPFVRDVPVARGRDDETPNVDRTNGEDTQPAPAASARRIDEAQSVRTFDSEPATAPATRDKPVRWLGRPSDRGRPAAAEPVPPPPAARHVESAVPRAGALPQHEHERIDSDVPAARTREQPATRAATRLDTLFASVATLNPAPSASNVHELPPPSATSVGSTSDDPSPKNEHQSGVARSAATDSHELVQRARVYPASIETEVGGIFYLLNVALCLGLYGDFTMPARPGIELSIWDFVTLAGRSLTPRRFRHDAVWALLADLAGRAPDEAPGATFVPPDDWRVPPDWAELDASCVVQPFPPALASEQGKLRRGTRVLARGAQWPARGPQWPALQRWTSWLMPYVRARLARALGESDRRRVGALLCVQCARVVTSATHVNVMFSLAELPIEVRLSGLDRDPGWIPAADRVVVYHYD